MIYVVNAWRRSDAERLLAVAWVEETGRLEGHHVTAANRWLVAHRVETVLLAPTAHVVATDPGSAATLLSALLSETGKPEGLRVADATEDEVARTSPLFARWWRLESLAP